ncbi:MAG: FHA domain-containing protein, partial [Bdellovibrionales bacterium]|nr:FHA domain-containing protein [Bdellovibrionales bacterium]
MWVLRFLNGPLAGQIINLKKGQNLIGRNPQCDIPIAHPGISKQHCTIKVSANEITIDDLNSSNGTFVNGLKIKSYKLSPNDKISLYDIMAEIINVADVNKGFSPAVLNPLNFYGTGHPSDSAAGLPPTAEMPFQANANDESVPPPTHKNNLSIPRGLEGFIKLAQNYIDEVVLPGIYKLAEWTEFKYVLMIFMGAFIIFVTTLSSIL